MPTSNETNVKEIVDQMVPDITYYLVNPFMGNPVVARTWNSYDEAHDYNHEQLNGAAMVAAY